MPDRLLSTADLAEYLGVPEKTLQSWRWRGSGPPYRHVGRHVRYRPQDVREWVESLPGGCATEVA